MDWDYIKFQVYDRIIFSLFPFMLWLVFATCNRQPGNIIFSVIYTLIETWAAKVYSNDEPRVLLLYANTITIVNKLKTWDSYNKNDDDWN